MKLFSRKALALGLAPVVAGGVAVVLSTSTASAATIGTVAFSPASGTWASATTLSADAACPGTSNRYSATITNGGTLPETNLIGTSGIPGGAGGTVGGVALADSSF